MARRRRRRGALQKLGADVLLLMADAREVSKTALQQLRTEIVATRRRLEKLISEERVFRLDLFGGGGPGRPPTVGRPRKTGRPVGRKAAVRKTGRRKGPPMADKYFAKLPKTFTIDNVRKLAGKAAPISVAQWSRAKRIKKTAKGYEKVA